MNPQQFAQKIKTKYPEYSDVDDLELTNKIIEKYPVYADQVKFNTPTVAKKPSLLEKTGNVLTSVFGGKQIGEAIGTQLAKAMVPKDQRQFVSPGPSGRELAGDVLQVGATLLPGVGSGARLATKLAVGAGTGYAFDIASKLKDKEKTALEVATPGIGTAVGAALPALGKITGLGKPGQNASKIASKLEEINLRLTPTDKQNLARTGSDVVDYLTRKKVIGTPAQRFLKVDNLYNKMEGQVSKVIKDSGKSFDRAKIIDEIKQIPELYVDDLAEYPRVNKAVERAINTLQTKFPEQIPAERVNSLKRAAWKSAFSKSNSQVINNALHDIGDVFKSNLDNEVAGLQKLNKEYGTLITARKLLSKAQSRNELGLIGKAVSTAASTALGGAVGSFGGPVGGFAGAATGTVLGPAIGQIVAGTPTRSAVGAGFKTISNAIDRIPTSKVGNLQITKKALIRLLQENMGQ